jgi:hypothetical protein
MKTTVLIVEFLVGGILVSLAMVFCVASVFPGVSIIPDEIEAIIEDLGQYPSLPVGVVLVTIVAAIAYGVGVFSEFIGLHLFEGRHDKIKRQYLIKYLKELKGDGINLKKSPLLKRFDKIPPDKITKEQARSVIGPIRFYVLKESPYLYQDIASQIHRLRLIRILFLVEIILIVAVAGQLHQEFSSHLIYALLFLVIIAIANVFAILDRFNRYCRAVLRSYRVLIFGY